MARELLMELQDMQINYRTRAGRINAVRSVSMDIRKGEIIGLVGESGCGKSTLAMTFLKLIMPPGEIVGGKLLYYGYDNGEGPVSVMELQGGKLRRYRWKEVSMIFQGSMNSLNPVMRVEDQIIDVMIDHDFPEEEARTNVDKYLSMAGMDPSTKRSYPHQLSGGMKQRVAIAIALTCSPKLIIADEPTTALDVVVQKQIMDQLKGLRDRLGVSIVFITHDIAVIGSLADLIYVMYAGKIVESGPVSEVCNRPRHPYTAALMSASPTLKGEKKRLNGIPGSPPDLKQTIVGCSFAPRCPFAFERCHIEEPQLKMLEPGHKAACFKLEDVK
ncbi:MAG: ABC transporter ATP-binding protein [Thermoplasmata archaeon]|nr:ABC transporter ATP-binding protein [Candidatus Sysuiplasma acidicola]MBX8646787.1 ABC transporter ATP-binding protein [Candidatus Sysuiplasma acidicola]